jgi:branched-chain amino acid transport system substrate-binding protein
MSQQQITIGLLATLIGPFKIMGEDAVRGAKLALSEFGHAVNGNRVRLAVESTNAIPQSAADAAYLLFARHKADFIVGPLSGNEGLAVKDYAKTMPDKTFLNGTSASQDLTLRDPAANFFNFCTHGVQWMAGLGTYIYKTLGCKKVVTLGEDYSYPYSQVAGLMLELCRAGGEVVKKIWVPLGTVDFAPMIASLTEDVDALFVALAGSDAVNFLRQYAESGCKTQLILGPSAVDQTVLGLKGLFPEHIVGVPASGPVADDNPKPAWQAFVKAYRDQFPDALPSPSLVAHGYYANMKAALLALQAVDCDLSGGQARFQKAVSHLEFETPSGMVKLDHNRQAIANIFVTVVEQNKDGTLYTKLIKETPSVNQTLGIPEEEYLKLGPITADTPTCEQIMGLSG